MKPLELLVNGKRYAGWKQASVKRSMTALSGSFNLAVTNRWEGQRQPWGIKPDDSAELLIAGESVITGFVDTLETSISKDANQIQISGRDKTADFVDCSADDKQYRDIPLDRLARELAKHFGLQVVVNTAIGAPFPLFQVNTGESGFEALERAARLRAVLLATDGKGRIVITQPGKNRATTAIVEGKNVLQASGKFSHTDRFSVYSVKGQRYALQDDLPAEFKYRMEGKAFDPNVKRFRPLVIQAEAALGDADSKRRAQWEATNRAAKAATFSVQLQGWTQADGSLWAPNLLVPVDLPSVGTSGDLLISEVSFDLADGGSFTSLSLVRKDAFQTDPTIKEKADPLEAAVRKEVKQ